MAKNCAPASTPSEFIAASATSAVRFFRLLQHNYSSPLHNGDDWEPPGPSGLRRSAAAPSIGHCQDSDEAPKWDLLRDSLRLGDHLEFLRAALDRYEFTPAFQDSSRAHLRRLGMRLADRRLFLGVVGEFSSGKSTLINALLREPFLQTDVLQGTTSVPTQVGYGHHLDAHVLFRDGTAQWFTRKCLSRRRRWPWLLGNLEQVSQADRDHLTEFLRQHTASPEAADKIATVYLAHPAKRFHTEGIVVVDTPGTCSADYPQHEQTTREAVRHLCDAVVVVIPATAPVSESLLKYLRANLEGLLPRCIFVVTKLDLVRRGERSRLVKYVQTRLENALNRPRPAVVAAAPGAFLQHCCPSESNGQEQAGGQRGGDIQALAQEYLAAEHELIEFLRAGKLLALAGGIAGRTAQLMTMLDKELKSREQECRGQREDLEEHPIPDLVELADRWKRDMRDRVWSGTSLLQEQAASSFQSACRSLASEAEKLISQTQNRTGLSAVVQTSLPQSLRQAEGCLQQSVRHVYGKIVDVAQKLHGEFVADFQKSYPTLATLGAMSSPGSSLTKSQEHREQFAKSVTSQIESTVRDFAQEANFKEWARVVGIAVVGLIIGTFIFPAVGTFFGGVLGGIVGRFFWQQWEQRKSAARAKVLETIENKFDEFRSTADQIVTTWINESEVLLLASVDAYAAKYQRAVQEMIERDERMKAKLLSLQKKIRADLDQLRHRHSDLRKAESNIAFSLLGPGQGDADYPPPPQEGLRSEQDRKQREIDEAARQQKLQEEARAQSEKERKQRETDEAARQRKLQEEARVQSENERKQREIDEVVRNQKSREEERKRKLREIDEAARKQKLRQEETDRAGKTSAGGPPLASRRSRLVAVAIDLFATLLVLVPGCFLVFSGNDHKDIPVGPLFMLGGVLILVCVQICLLLTQGQSIGKKVVGVRIIKQDGGSPGFVGAVLLRVCVPWLIGAIPYAGQAFALVNLLFIFGEKRRCLHDRIAGTIVVEVAARK